MSSQSRYPAPSTSRRETLENKEARYRSDPILSSIFMRPPRPELHPSNTWECCLNPVTAFYNKVVDKNLRAYSMYQNFEYARHTASRLFPPHVLAEMSRRMDTKLEEVNLLERQWTGILERTAAFFRNSPMSNYAILPPYSTTTEHQSIIAGPSYMDGNNNGAGSSRQVYDKTYQRTSGGYVLTDGQIKNEEQVYGKRKWSDGDLSVAKKGRMTYHTDDDGNYGASSNSAMK